MAGSTEWASRFGKNREVGGGEGIVEDSKYTYGSHRMAEGLQALGYSVGRYQARSLMWEAEIFVRYRRRFRITTNSEHKQPVFPNFLKREFTVSAPNRV